MAARDELPLEARTLSGVLDALVDAFGVYSDATVGAFLDDVAAE